MVSVVDDKDCPGKAEIDAETVGLAVGRDFLGMGDNGTRIFRGDLEHLQVVLFDFGGHRVDEGPEGPVKGRMELVGNAAGDVAWVLEHTITSLGRNGKSASCHWRQDALTISLLIRLHEYNI